MTYGSSQTDKIVLLRPNFRPNMDEKLSCQHTPPPLSPPADEDHAIETGKDSKESLSAFKKQTCFNMAEKLLSFLFRKFITQPCFPHLQMCEEPLFSPLKKRLESFLSTVFTGSLYYRNRWKIPEGLLTC